MSDEPTAPLRAVVITADAVYQGSVPQLTPSSRGARFLDILRAPARVGQAAIGARAGLTLVDVVRTPRGGGKPLSFTDPVVLRPAAILAAYDLGGGGHSAPQTEYEQRGKEQRSRVRIFLEGRLGLEAVLAGGMRTVEAVRTQTFVACTDVELILGRRQRLPFLAINSERIESLSRLDDGEGGDRAAGDGDGGDGDGNGGDESAPPVPEAGPEG